MNKTTTTTKTRGASHTPGPWRVAPDGVTIHCGDENDPEIVAAVDIADPMAVSVDVQEANARLIAAAPELLEALEKSDKRIEQLCEMVNSYARHLGIMDAGKSKVRAEDWAKDARAAIAKAKGQP